MPDTTTVSTQTAAMDRYALRRKNFALSADRGGLRTADRKFNTRCPIELVWAAESAGFDQSSEKTLGTTNVTSTALPEFQ